MASPAKSGGSFSQRLTRKVGPLPVWAWAAVILAGGYLVYRARNKGAANASSSAASQPAAVPSTSDQTGTGDAGIVGAGTGTDLGASAIPPDYTGQFGLISSQLDALTAAILAEGNPAPVPDGGPPGSSVPAPVAPPTGKVGGVAPRVPAGSVPVAPTPLGYAAAYNPTTGVTSTPEGAKIAPTVTYSSSPKAKQTVKGPSVFAFK